MHHSMRHVALLALLPLVACAGSERSITPPAPIVPAAPALSAADQSFIQTAAMGWLAEMQLAQLAQQKTHSAEVRRFATRMVQDHTPNNQQLAQLAQQKGVTPPSSLDDAHQQELTKLQGESGSQFNRDYIASQISGHQAMLDVFQSEVQNGQDPDLKNFAQQTIPGIQSHLTMAQGLQAGHLRPGMYHHTTQSGGM
jgi:putative membrane protein